MLKSWVLIPVFLLQATNKEQSLWLCEDPGTCSKDRELTEVSGVSESSEIWK